MKLNNQLIFLAFFLFKNYFCNISSKNDYLSKVFNYKNLNKKLIQKLSQLNSIITSKQINVNIILFLYSFLIILSLILNFFHLNF